MKKKSITKRLFPRTIGVEDNANRLYCFSPPVMLATMIIEFGGAIYLTLRYKLNQVGRLVVAVLIFLGIFQLAEYVICTSTGLTGLTWARIGFVAITMLPPLGISLAMALAGKKSWPAQAVMYTMAAAFIVYFAFVGNSLTDQICGGNYVIFTANQTGMRLYGIYYFSLLAISTILCVIWARASKEVQQRRSLYALCAGYLAFIVPTIIVWLVYDGAGAAIPSIMCGFAVLLAITLLVFVMPYGGMKRKVAKK